MSPRRVTTTLRAVIALVPLMAVACSSSGPFDPDDVEQVRIELGVSGGFAGMDFRVVLDGAELEMRGVQCTSFCDFDAGDVILPVSARLVGSLMSRFEDAGVYDLGGDYGTRCCDQIDYDLRVVRGSNSVRITGSGEELPDEITDELADLMALADGRAPVFVEPTTDPAAWPSDPYTILDVQVEGTSLAVEVQYGGGCRPHAMDFVVWGGWTDTDPPGVNALLSHDARGDNCEALVTETRRFDLAPLVRAALARYGSDGPDAIDLHLRDPVTGNPSGWSVRVEL